MGLKKVKRLVQKVVHGYDYPKIIKSKPWTIKPADRICVLAPHPDDETIACGGLLLKYGAQCDVVLLTDGQKGGLAGWSTEKTVSTRQKEFEQVMEFLKVRHFEYVHAEDLSLLDAYDEFSKIDFSQYTYVLMPHPFDAHVDHGAVSALWKRLQKAKALKAQSVYYELWSPLRMPTHYIDISDVIEEKCKAISFYESQLKNVNYISRIVALNHYRGIRHGVEYEEDFEMGSD